MNALNTREASLLAEDIINELDRDFESDEQSYDPNEDATEDRSGIAVFIDPVAKELLEKAVDFMGRYPDRNGTDQLAKAIDNDPAVGIATLLQAAAEGHLVPENPVASYRLAMIFTGKLCHQITSTAFFALRGRELKRERERDVRTMPTADRQMSPAMIDLLTKLDVYRPMLETDSAVADKIVTTDSDATPLEAASDLDIRESVVDIHDFLSTVHAGFFKLAFERDIAEPIGYASIQTPDGNWTELHSFDSAYQVFCLNREQKHQDKQASAKAATKNLLKNLLGKAA